MIAGKYNQEFKELPSRCSHGICSLLAIFVAIALILSLASTAWAWSPPAPSDPPASDHGGGPIAGEGGGGSGMPGEQSGGPSNGPSAPGSDNKNTEGENGGCTNSPAPVRYIDGSITLIDDDLSSPAGFETSLSRSFRNNLKSDFDGPVGYNWQLEQWPSLIETTTGDNSEFVAMLPGNRDFYFHQDGQSSTWLPKHGNPKVMSITKSGDTFVLNWTKNNASIQFVFNDFSVAKNQRGMIKKRIDSAGNGAVVTYNLDGYIGALEKTLTVNGNTVTYAAHYTYYTSGASTDKLHYVVLQKQINGGGWTNIRRSKYVYYNGTQYSSSGSLNDLQMTIIQKPDGLGGWIDIAKTYYRYYAGTYSQASTPGNLHMLKYKLDPEGYRKMKADSHNPLTASDSTLAKYAQYYFEYDSESKVIKEVAARAKSFSGDLTTLTDSFSRIKNPNYPANPTDPYNTWQWKTTVTHADNTKTIVYSDKFGKTMLMAFKDISGKLWCSFWKYNSRGLAVMEARPSAISGFAPSPSNNEPNDLLNKQSGNYQYLNDNSGLIRKYVYYSSTSPSISNTTSGGVKYYKKYNEIQKGELSAPIKQYKFTYYAHQVAGHNPIYPIAQQIVYPSTANQALKVTTNYHYQWNDAYQPNRVTQASTTFPAVSTSKNGSGNTTSAVNVYDDQGYLQWHKDKRGIIDYYQRDPNTGKLLKQIKDVDTTKTSEFSDLPSGWSTKASFGANLITTYSYDGLGRLTRQIAPSRDIVDNSGQIINAHPVTWTLYLDNGYASLNAIRTIRGYATGSPGSYSFYRTNPLTIVKLGKDEHFTYQTIATKSTQSTGEPTSSESFSQSDYLSWTVNSFNKFGKLIQDNKYFAIPTTGYGTSSVNYYKTSYAYDSTTHTRIRAQKPDGTILRFVSDSHDRKVQTWMGTNDSGATPNDPSNGGAAPNNMVQTSKIVYDQGNDGGDGNVTQASKYYSNSGYYATEMQYDWRDRLTDTRPSNYLATKLSLNNLGKVIEVDTYYDANTNFTIDSGELKSKQTQERDSLGRVYRKVKYDVDSSGSAGDSLTTNIWYDCDSNIIKTEDANGLFHKFSFDGLGRQIASYISYDDSENSYSDAFNVTGDTVISQTLTSYDGGSNPWLVRTFKRNDNANTTGALTSSDSRVNFAANWFDSCSRNIESVNYGTNGGTVITSKSDDFDPATSGTQVYTDGLPATGATTLYMASATSYNDAGKIAKSIDNAGYVTKFVYNDLGRKTSSIENYVTGSPQSDQNKQTNYTYNSGGNLKIITAKGAQGGDELTYYFYNSPLNGSFRTDIVYPDGAATDVDGSGNLVPSSTDHVHLTFNRLGRTLTRTDQSGNVHTYTYNTAFGIGAGRLASDAVTTLGSGVDGSVRRIGFTYDDLSRRTKATSYDAASGGNVVNQVKFTYADSNGDWGQLTKLQQNNSGAVIGSSPAVDYAYSDGAVSSQAKYVRLTSVTYPGPATRKTIYYNYPSSGIGAKLSRVDNIAADASGTIQYADYSYVGANTIYKATHPKVTGGLTLNYDTAGDHFYAGWDRFGRVTDQKWTNSGASTTFDQYKYAYGKSGNRTYRENTQTTGKDEFYTYDGLNRLTDLQRGTLNAGKIGITGTPALKLQYTLYKLGNWTNYVTKTSGTTSLDQNRTHNLANEIAGNSGNPITETTGPSWAQPVYDDNGNQTAGPHPGDETSKNSYVYDAWNRLVKVKNSSGSVIATYNYNALGWRVSKTLGPASNENGAVYNFYYNANWQVLEVDKTPSGGPSYTYKQYVWSLRYIDAPVCRFRDTNADGTLDETLYYTEDANFNVTALVDTSGAVVERYSYSAYGQAQIYSANWTSRTSSSYDNNILFGGYRYDSQSGLYAVRHRVYNPSLGRWMQRDPMGYVNGLSLYVYVNGNTIILVDPQGLSIFGGVLSLALTGHYNSSASATGILSAGAHGAQGGVSIEANTLSYGATNHLGVTNSTQYQGGAYTVTRISSHVARASLESIVTGGGSAVAGKIAEATINSGRITRIIASGTGAAVTENVFQMAHNQENGIPLSNNLKLSTISGFGSGSLGRLLGDISQEANSISQALDDSSAGRAAVLQLLNDLTNVTADPGIKHLINSITNHIDSINSNHYSCK